MSLTLDAVLATADKALDRIDRLIGESAPEADFKAAMAAQASTLAGFSEVMKVLGAYIQPASAEYEYEGLADWPSPDHQAYAGAEQAVERLGGLADRAELLIDWAGSGAVDDYSIDEGTAKTRLWDVPAALAAAMDQRALAVERSLMGAVEGVRCRPSDLPEGLQDALSNGAYDSLVWQGKRDGSESDFNRWLEGESSGEPKAMNCYDCAFYLAIQHTRLSKEVVRDAYRDNSGDDASLYALLGPSKNLASAHGLAFGDIVLLNGDIADHVVFSLGGDDILSLWAGDFEHTRLSKLFRDDSGRSLRDVQVHTRFRTGTPVVGESEVPATPPEHKCTVLQHWKALEPAGVQCDGNPREGLWLCTGSGEPDSGFEWLQGPHLMCRTCSNDGRGCRVCGSTLVLQSPSDLARLAALPTRSAGKVPLRDRCHLLQHSTSFEAAKLRVIRCSSAEVRAVWHCSSRIADYEKVPKERGFDKQSTAYGELIDDVLVPHRLCDACYRLHGFRCFCGRSMSDIDSL